MLPPVQWRIAVGAVLTGGVHSDVAYWIVESDVARPSHGISGLDCDEVEHVPGDVPCVVAGRATRRADVLPSV